MRIIHLCCTVLLAACSASAGARPSPAEDGPERVVQARHDAFNRRDLVALLAAYAPDATLREQPGDTAYHGATELREVYKQQFVFMPRLRVEVRERTVEGRTVVDELHYSGFPCGGTYSARVTFEVQDGRIRTETSVVLHDDVVPALFAGPAPACFPPGPRSAKP